MHLVDKVAQATGPLVVNLPGMPRAWPLPGCNIVAPLLRDCPIRYVLGDDVTELCTELAFEEESILASSLELLRVPGPRLWIEFNGRARQKAFAECGRLSSEAMSAFPQRVGLLIASDDTGRKGQMDVCWDGPDGEDLAPFVIAFDFDRPDFSDTAHAGDDGAWVGVDVGEHPVFTPLFGHVRFNLRPEWYRYYIERSTSHVHYRQILKDAVQPLVEDVPFFATFCLLLMSRTAFFQHAADRSQINKARARRGRPPLLDHVELSMNLGAGSANGAAGAGVPRSSPRLHFVRGHLVRRGGAVFWRTSHMRGKPAMGVIRSRTISLQLGGCSAI